MAYAEKDQNDDIRAKVRGKERKGETESERTSGSCPEGYRDRAIATRSGKRVVCRGR